MKKERYTIYQCRNCESENLRINGNDVGPLRDVAYCYNCEHIDFVKKIRLCVYCLDKIGGEEDGMNSSSCKSCQDILFSDDENIIKQKSEIFQKLKKLGNL